MVYDHVFNFIVLFRVFLFGFCDMKNRSGKPFAQFFE